MLSSGTFSPDTWNLKHFIQILKGNLYIIVFQAYDAILLYDQLMQIWKSEIYQYDICVLQKTNIFKLLPKAYCIYRIRLKNEGTIVESSFKVYWKKIGDNSFSIYYTIGYTYQDSM